MAKVIVMEETLLAQIQELRKAKRSFVGIRKEIGEERLRAFLRTLYPKHSFPEIEQITGIPDSTLGFWFKRLGIDRVRRHITNFSVAAQEGFEFVITKNSRALRVHGIKLTPELAYLIGFAIGDGNIEQYTVSTYNRNNSLHAPIDRSMQSYGVITDRIRPDGLWKLRLSSVRIASLIKDKRGIRKDTLAFIFHHDELARKFIAAFWDAEGTVRKQKKYYHIYLYNSNTYLLEKVKKFLKSKSIAFSTFFCKQRKNEYLLKGRRIIPRKIVERISIPKSCFVKWAKEIGVHMNHSKKKIVVKEILEMHRGGA